MPLPPLTLHVFVTPVNHTDACSKHVDHAFNTRAATEVFRRRAPTKSSASPSADSFLGTRAWPNAAFFSSALMVPRRNDAGLCMLHHCSRRVYPVAISST